MSKPLQLWKNKSVGVSRALWCQLSTDPDSGSKYIYKLVDLVDKEKPFICGECERKFRTRAQLNQHFIRRHRPLQFKCSQCEKRFSYQSLLKRHVETEHGEAKKQIECPTCGKNYKTKISLKNHILKHSKDYRPVKYECKFIFGTKKINCDGIFDTKKELHEHYEDKHPEKRDIACDKCPMKFFTKSTLNTHIRRFHSGSTILYKCDHCGKLYKGKYAYQQHVDYVHLGKREHLCGKCEAAFPNRSSLNVHMKSHKERAVLCLGGCGKMFRYREDMLKHYKARHTGRYDCPDCYMEFKGKVSLAKHREQHRPCPITGCDRRFTTNDYGIICFKGHMKEHLKQGIMTCVWTGCETKFPDTIEGNEDLDRHYKKHREQESCAPSPAATGGSPGTTTASSTLTTT